MSVWNENENVSDVNSSRDPGKCHFPLSSQVAMFVLQLGSATFLLTEPVISAMTTGAATHVVTSQVKYLLGMKMPYISGPLGFFYVSFPYVFVRIFWECVSQSRILVNSNTEIFRYEGSVGLNTTFWILLM